MDWRRQRGEEEEVPEQLMYCEEGLTMDVLSARVHVCVCVCVCFCVRACVPFGGMQGQPRRERFC